jgi:hypothetical protein
VCTGKAFCVCDPEKRNCLEQHRADPEDESHTHRFAHGPRTKKRKKAAPASQRHSADAAAGSS